MFPFRENFRFAIGFSRELPAEIGRFRMTGVNRVLSKVEFDIQMARVTDEWPALFKSKPQSEYMFTPVGLESLFVSVMGNYFSSHFDYARIRFDQCHNSTSSTIVCRQ